MQILECSYGVLRVPQIPNIEARILVVIICHNELGRDGRIPYNLRLFGLNSLLLLTATVLRTEIVVLADLLLARFSELEN